MGKSKEKRREYYNKFSPEKLDEIEKQLYNIFAKNEKGKFVSVVAVVIAALNLALVSAFSLRYIGEFREILDYDRLLVFSQLQKIADGLYAKCHPILQFLFPVIVFVALGVIALLITSAVDLFMHFIKTLALKNASFPPVKESDNLGKVKALMDLEKKIEEGLNETFEIVLAVVVYVLSIVALVLTNLSGGIKENVWRLIGMAAFVVFCTYVIGWIYIVFFSILDETLSCYSQKRNEIRDILDRWWPQLDKEEGEKRSKEADEAWQRQKDRELEARVQKMNENKETKLPDIMMPHIDVTGM